MVKLMSANDDGVNVQDEDLFSSKLSNINWSFSTRRFTTPTKIYPFNCRKYHWYPATFIPEIPFTLIEVISNSDAIIYDPFGGIGTTFFQSLFLQRLPITTEINSVAIMYMRALLQLINPKNDLNLIKRQINDIIAGYSPEDEYGDESDLIPCIERLRPWYSEETFHPLCYLIIQSIGATNENVRSALSLAISANLQTLSNQDRGWGCIADNVLPKQEQIKTKDPLSTIINHCKGLFRDVTTHLSLLGPSFDKHYKQVINRNSIINNNVKNKIDIENETVDLLITSPPYPNMADYTMSQRLSYYYLGIDINRKENISPDDFEYEIGARRKRHKQIALDNYLKDMNQSNLNIISKLKIGGIACYILPEFSTRNTNDTKRTSIINRMISNLERVGGLKRINQFSRVLPSKRRHHNQKWATLEKENIYIYRRVK